MQQGLRSSIETLRQKGELLEIKKAVDVRYVTPLLWQTEKALHFQNIKGYDAEMVGGLVVDRSRAAALLGCRLDGLAQRFLEGVNCPIQPVLVKESPTLEVIQDRSDLSVLPIPFMHDKDGGPFLTSAMVVSKDPKYGRNVGIYRLMYRSPNELSVDLKSHSDLRTFYERALHEGRPLPVAAILGADYPDMLAATYKCPTGTDEYTIAGGLKGEPVPLVRCRKVDLEVPAYAEVIIEGELLPVGWTKDEGPFGDMSGVNGGLKYNPIFRVTAVSHRRRPILHFLKMPRENNWCHGPAIEGAALRALQNARIDVAAINATQGGMCYWELIASIRKRPGEGKNALAALLSVAEVKLAIVTDDDIDIYDREDVAWAMALRVQADRDLVVIPGTRGKHLDPSAQMIGEGEAALPVSARLGIDATIPEGVSRSRYERVAPAFLSSVRLEDYLGSGYDRGPDPGRGKE